MRSSDRTSDRVARAGGVVAHSVAQTDNKAEDKRRVSTVIQDTYDPPAHMLLLRRRRRLLRSQPHGGSGLRERMVGRERAAMLVKAAALAGEPSYARAIARIQRAGHVAMRLLLVGRPPADGVRCGAADDEPRWRGAGGAAAAARTGAGGRPSSVRAASSAIASPSSRAATPHGLAGRAAAAASGYGKAIACADDLQNEKVWDEQDGCETARKMGVGKGSSRLWSQVRTRRAPPSRQARVGPPASLKRGSPPANRSRKIAVLPHFSLEKWNNRGTG